MTSKVSCFHFCTTSGESGKEEAVRGDQNKELGTQGHHCFHLPHFCDQDLTFVCGLN